MTEASPRHPPAEPLTVSIKPSAEYDSALLVYKGTPSSIQQNLTDWFGLEVDEGETPHGTFLRAESAARAGATPTSAKPKQYGKQWPSKSQPKQEEEHPFAEVLGLIEIAKTVDDLKRIWVDNKDAFNHPDVEAARAEKAASFAPVESHEEAVQNAAEGLGASVVEETVEEPQEATQAPQEPSPQERVLEAIEGARTLSELSRAYVVHRKLLDEDKSLQEAYAAKNKTLKAGA